MTEEQLPLDQQLSVMLLGAGELSDELVTAFQRLGAVVSTVDVDPDAPAHRAADHNFVVKVSDPDELMSLVEREKPDYVVAETPDRVEESAVANDALATIAESGITVVPSVRSRRLSVDRESLRRLAADELGLPTLPFWFAGSVEELTDVAAQAGCPLVVRPAVGKPGDGESVVVRPDDFDAAWNRATAACTGDDGARVMIEPVVDIDHKVTLLTVRGDRTTASGVRFCEPIGHRRLGDDVLEAWQPQPMTPAARDAAKSIAARIVNALGGRGVCGVELLVKGDDVYFADFSPWPFDSGLVTLRSQRLSAFDLHARSILGLPVDTIMITPGAAEVLYAGEPEADTGEGARPRRLTRALAYALAVPESDVRILGHPGSGPPRRLAVTLATGTDATAARGAVRRVTAALREKW